MKRLLSIVALGACALLGACNDADVVSRNISTDADNFRVNRRIVFYNTHFDKVMLTIEGKCSLGNVDNSGELSVTCKTGSGYHKEFLGLSRDVTYMVQQIEDSDVSPNHYKVVWQPSQMVPSLEIK